jgi:hypothetical protein
MRTHLWQASCAAIAAGLVSLGTAPSLARADTPSYVGSFSTFGAQDARDVFVLWHYAYVVTENNPGSAPEFYIVDITTPAAPVQVPGGFLNVGGRVNKVYVEGDYAYLATNQNLKELVILNIANKGAPVEVGSYNAPSAMDGLSVAAVGSTVYLGTRNNTSGAEFYILDAKDPGAVSVMVT